MKLRHLTPGDDLSAAIHLLQRFFAEEGFDTPPHVIAERVRALAGLETCLLIVAEAGSETVGVATASMEFGIEFGWWAEMGDLYVLPEARGTGVAKLLVEGIEAWLRAKGVAGYQVTVTPEGEDHHGLRAYYRKLGFRGDGRLLLFKEL